MIKMFPKLIFDLTSFLVLHRRCYRSTSLQDDLFATEAAAEPGDGSLCRNLRSLDHAFDATVRTSSRCRAPRCVLRLRPFVSPTWPAALAFSWQPAYSGTAGRC